MATPEKNSLSAKDQFFLATWAGEYFIQLKANTRKRKSGPGDERLTEHQSRLRRNDVADFLFSIRPSLAFLAIEWADDDQLRDQIQGDADPIVIFNAETNFSLEVYADMLALTSLATNRTTTGRYEGVKLQAAPRTATADVVLQYKKARPTPTDSSF